MKQQIFAIMAIGFLAANCGSDSSSDDNSDKSDTTESALPQRDGFNIIEVGEQYFYLNSEEPLSSGCDNVADFILRAGVDSQCEAVNIEFQIQDDSDDRYDWQVNSNDGHIDFEAVEDESDGSLTIDGTKYYCYEYFDDAIPTDSDITINLVDLNLITKETADTPADIDQETGLFAVMTSDTSFCKDYLRKK